MKKNVKTLVLLIIGLIIGVSTTVGAATVFNSKDITYSSSATTKTNVKDSLDELYTKANTPWKCATGYYCYTTFCPTGYTQGTDSEGFSVCKKYKPISEVKVGDYISMTPTATSYMPDSTLTGYNGTSQRELLPRELNLWRVIRKNSDGTIDVVSEYVTSRYVIFYGSTGYKNFIGVLNAVAAQFTNSKYVSKTRHMGDINQIEQCPNVSLADCPTNGSPGDTNLVQSALGTLKATNSSGAEYGYWLATRARKGTYTLTGFYVTPDGEVERQDLSDTRDNALYYVQGNYMVRPILTLKADIQIKSGDGTSNSPYQLS